MSKIIPVSVPSGPFNTKGLLSQVVSMSPDRPLNVAEIRQRVKILDAIEAADTSFVLENDQYDILATCLRKFPFNVANKQILQVCDDVLDAKDGPVITKAMRDAALAEKAQNIES